MTVGTTLVARQLWGLPTMSTVSLPHCTPFTLPSNGIIALPSTTITLADNAVFSPLCNGNDFAISADGSPAAYENPRDPFYASVTPQVYVIAATTVIAWILVLMLVITPRTSFYGASAAQPGFNHGHGIIGGAHGGTTSLTGVGSRPWLQKAAALTVAISLTIATADTFLVAQNQYNIGYMDATALREQVIGSLEIRITRVISDVFVWLAQVQTLIRLFPRHKEKVLIKWIGFCLIICDTTFSCLNSFLVNSQRAPRYFSDAIPAFSYLFELALGLLYAAWVIYYSLTKRRYAFYSTKMKSVSLIALLSLIAVLTPVVFFITDISNQDVASWGDYFRWVGAAAASVVVWEWVERIEAIERDEKKDGILGRELFDDDDMLDEMPDSDVIWTPGRRARGGSRRQYTSHNMEDGAHSSPQSPTTAARGHPARGHTSALARSSQHLVLSGIERPQPVASPLSRTDTSSAGSTVYVVRVEPAAGVPQPIRRRPDPARRSSQDSIRRQSRVINNAADAEKSAAAADDAAVEARQLRRRTQDKWYTVANPFKRKRASPPAEVQKAQRDAMSANERAQSATPKHNFSRWDVRNRFGVLAGDAGDLFWSRVGRTDTEHRDQQTEDVIVIPAQPRGSDRTWSPALLDSHSTTADGQSWPAQSGTGPQDSFSHHGRDPISHSQPGLADVTVRDSRPDQTSSSEQLSARSTQHTPPRPSDFDMTAGSASDIVVVPAPRRSPTSGGT